MTWTVVLERVTLEVLPSGDGREACRSRHRVEFGGWGIPHGPRPQADALAVHELHEMAVSALGVGVVFRDRQHHFSRGHRADADRGALARRVFGHERLDNEMTARGQSCRDSSEARLLTRCALQVEQRVVREEHDVERSVGQVVDHVADRHGDCVGALASAQAVDHCVARVDTVDGHAASGNREGQPPSTDGELEDAGSAFARCGAPEFGDDVRRRLGVADTRVPIVVDVGERVAVRSSGVTLHGDGFYTRSGRLRPLLASSVVDRLVYLDHAATTPMRDDAVEAMLPFLTERFANPSGSHRFARDARKAVDEARDRVAAAVGCRPGEIVFTGCGTEADNAAIAGAGRVAGGRAVCSAAEHHAVLHAVERAHGTVVAVDAVGRMDESGLRAALGDDVRVVSVMAVNNEVGTVTDVASVAAIVRDGAPGAVVHTDAIQAACWLDLRELWPHVDLMSLSAHKFGGPKGVGALVIREGTSVDPLIVGGGQERERRSGTHNVAGIVAMSVALAGTDAERVDECARIAALRDRLVAGLVAGVPGLQETVAPQHKVAGSAHVLVTGVESESLLYLLDEAGVCASAASACASGAMDPSHVLAAMGIDRVDAAGALRLTLGRTTTDADVEDAIAAITGAVATLRERTAARARR